MAVRKYILTVFFIALLAISYIYLENKYNVKTVEFSFSGELSKADVENLTKSSRRIISKSSGVKDIPFVINYTSSLGDSKLIMTSGLDSLVYEMPLLNGRWIVNDEIREAVLGDKAADRFFRNANVVGQTIRFFGQEYKIVGLLKNSNDIYISYDENSRAQWNKKSIKFIIGDEKHLYLYVELLEGALKGLGLDVTDVNIYKQEAYWYINIILVIAMLTLIRGLKSLWKRIDKSGRQIYSSYKEQIRVIELHRYIYKNRNEIAALLSKLIIEVVLLFAVLKCMTLLQISPGWIPSNLFSPTSYIEVIKVNLQSYISRLENGISGILLEIHIINLLLILYIGVAIIIKRNWDAKKL